MDLDLSDRFYAMVCVIYVYPLLFLATEKKVCHFGFCNRDLTVESSIYMTDPKVLPLERQCWTTKLKSPSRLCKI
jgi:hypothetical protein